MIKKSHNKYDKKPVLFKTPDLSKMQEVVIDGRTRIYITQGADPEKARNRYLARLEARGNVFIPGKGQ
jgi:hypothetical protein